MDNLICQAVAPVEMPVDPIVEVDENGRHVLLHRQVRSPGTEFHYMRNFTKQGPPKHLVL